MFFLGPNTHGGGKVGPPPQKGKAVASEGGGRLAPGKGGLALHQTGATMQGEMGERETMKSREAGGERELDG